MRSETGQPFAARFDQHTSVAPSYPTTNSIAAAAVRANQLPRVVSFAEALLPSMVIVNIPSRLKSATVIPETGLSSALAASETHAPCRLCRMPPPFKQARRAARLAGERIAVGAGCSLDARTIAVARFSHSSSAISPAFPHSPTTRDMSDAALVPVRPTCFGASATDTLIGFVG